MNATLYILTCLTTLLCAILLLRAYFRVRRRLLLWSGLCFAGLSATNLLLVFDKLVFTTVDLSPWRNGLSLLSMCVLLYGLIWNAE